MHHPKKWAKKLTYNAEVVIVRRFREYPDRAVGKIQRAEGSRKAHAIWPPHLTQVRQVYLRYTGYKRFTAGHS
jgi:hypothetical protein